MGVIWSCPICWGKHDEVDCPGTSPATVASMTEGRIVMEHREAQAVTGAPALHVDRETPKPAEQQPQPAAQPAQPQEQQEVTTTTTVKPAQKDEPKQ